MSRHYSLAAMAELNKQLVLHKMTWDGAKLSLESKKAYWHPVYKVYKAILDTFTPSEYYYWWRRVRLVQGEKTNSVLIICENDFIRHNIKNLFIDRLVDALHGTGITPELPEVLPCNLRPVGVA